jgi:hypothetical protein
VTYLDDMDKMPDYFKFPFHDIYASQENFLSVRPTYSSDLESLALMTHHLLLGELCIIHNF